MVMGPVILKNLVLKKHSVNAKVFKLEQVSELPEDL